MGEDQTHVSIAHRLRIRTDLLRLRTVGSLRDKQYLLDVLQSLDDSDVVQVNPPCRIPVLDGGAAFRDCQALQELQQVVMVVVDDAVCGGSREHKGLLEPEC